ncbi:MAG: hypothetical protein COB54_00350 [Alphaproteobacteria bacterium]|nr:MAG: hypothetical protein COB54_00350 [Alphaproteobacteria bacterium]
MKKITSLAIILFCLVWAPTLAADNNGSKTADTAAINSLMEGFHDAAAQADKERYLGYFTTDGVFMGTDDWERWPMEPDFKEYVAGRFKGGTGWTYTSLERHIAFAPGNKVAWFDEITKSEKWGLFRGTGVVLKQDGQWKVAHYSMSVLVANEAWVAVSDLNKAAVKRRKADKQ